MKPLRVARSRAARWCFTSYYWGLMALVVLLLINMVFPYQGEQGFDQLGRAIAMMAIVSAFWLYCLIWMIVSGIVLHRHKDRFNIGFAWAGVVLHGITVLGTVLVIGALQLLR